MRVVHCAEALLARTETFVRARMEPRAHEHVALGWHRVRDGLSVPCESHIVERRTAAVLGESATAINPELLNMADAAAALKALRPDLVHAHFGPTGIRVLPACVHLRIPLVVSFYGSDVAQAQEPRFQPYYQRLFAAVNVLTAEGPALARALVRCGARPRSVRLLPLSLPPWGEEEPVPRHEDPSALRLLQIARFVEKKGIEDGLRAVALARQAGIPVRFTIVGSGPLEPAIRSAVSAMGLMRAVTLRPPLAHEELGAALAKADAFLHPSRTASNGDTEGGHPTVILEAMSQRVPILATHHADIPFAVRHDVAGLLVPEHDPVALAESIASYWRSPELRRRHGEAGRTLVLRRHGREQVAALRDRLYVRAGNSAQEIETCPSYP